MKQVYKIGKTVGKCLAPVLVGATLLMGCEKKATELPINDTTKQTIQYKQTQQLDGIMASYQAKLDSAEKEFNEAIADGFFYPSEQKSVYNQLEDAKKLLKEATESAESTNIERYKGVAMPKEAANLHGLLRRNLKGLDLGMPELEKSLRSNGLDVKVADCKSELEGTYLPTAAIIGMAILFIGTMLYLAGITNNERT